MSDPDDRVKNMARHPGFKTVSQTVNEFHEAGLLLDAKLADLIIFGNLIFTRAQALQVETAELAERKATVDH